MNVINKLQKNAGGCHNAYPTGLFWMVRGMGLWGAGDGATLSDPSTEKPNAGATAGSSQIPYPISQKFGKFELKIKHRQL